MSKKNLYKAIKAKHEASSGCAYILEIFGDTLAKRESYKENNGINAIHFYIVHNFKWPPSLVKSMSSDDLQFILSEEMSGWTAPKEARDL